MNSVIKKSLSKQILKIRDFYNCSIDKIVEDELSDIRETPYLTSKSHIRISSLPYLCPRQEAICTAQRYTRSEAIPHKTMITFDFGHAFEGVIRDKVFAKRKVLVGMFECLNCGWVHGAVDGDKYINEHGQDEAILRRRIPRPDICNVEISGYGRCEGTEFRFLEELVEHQMFRVKGHPDGLLSSAMYDHVLEIKTCNDHRFKMAKRRPFKEHLEQAMFYAWLLQKRKILIYYFNKNTSEYMSYDLFVDNDVIQRLTNRLHITWKSIREIEKTGTIKELPQRICETKNDTRAKKCENRDYCFSCLD